jgi:excisionase family DNA binding protein
MSFVWKEAKRGNNPQMITMGHIYPGRRGRMVVAQAGSHGACHLTGGNVAEQEFLTPAEVAVMFRVNPKTVTRWARSGKISAIRTLGGHRRFRAAEIRRFLDNAQEGQTL